MSERSRGSNKFDLRHSNSANSPVSRTRSPWSGIASMSDRSNAGFDLIHSTTTSRFSRWSSWMIRRSTDFADSGCHCGVCWIDASQWPGQRDCAPCDVWFATRVCPAVLPLGSRQGRAPTAPWPLLRRTKLCMGILRHSPSQSIPDQSRGYRWQWVRRPQLCTNLYRPPKWVLLIPSAEHTILRDIADPFCGWRRAPTKLQFARQRAARELTRYRYRSNGRLPEHAQGC
jgi:hypothetical protein